MNKSPDLKQQVTVLKRELSIEASLEKVRTNAMTMKRPDDMLKICKTISQQLQKLGVQEICNVQTAIINPDKGTYLNYEYYSKHNKLITTEVAYTNHPMSRAFVKKMLGGSDEFFKKSLKGKKVQDWYNFQKKSTNQFADKFLLNASSLNYYWYSLGPVALGISTYEPLNKGEQELIVRFRNVFELSYRRFLDIQKAEAQAREAQIQLALERVRARTMAMQKSEELPETSHLLFEQMKELGEPVEQLTIGIVNEENNVIEISATLLGDTLKKIYSHSIEEPYMMAKVYRAWKNQQKTLVVELRGDELNAYNQYRNELTNSKMFPTNLGKEQQRIVYAAFFSKGMLALGSHETRPPESLQLLVKFASVFDLTYTRFLDLQKAETQAREAQIETAMEKVRSRSLAMQRPEELIEVAELLRKEMGQLGVEELETSSIYIIDNENKKAECWYAIKDVRKKNTKLISDEMTLILTDTWVGKEMWKFYQSANEQASILMKGEQRREWINYCAKHSKVLQGYYGNEIPERTYHLVKFNGGYMGAASPGDISKESWDLLKRATAVFSLAYTRFKDLQDAAARAREAQIELALERVRSRSMAMHKSDELKEVIRLVLEQFVHLKINAEHAGFYIDYKAHDDMHIWLADPNIEPFFTIIPYFDTPTWNSFLEAKANGTTLHTDLLDFKEKNKFYQSLFKIFTIPDEAKKFYLQCKGLAVSTVLLDNVGLYIENFSAIPYTDEENAVLIRFGKVFQQTYTRFLDLQKAEAQSRENQIQLALERVRARTMAMYKSDELSEVAGLLFKQVKELGIKTWTTGFNIWSDDNNFYTDYITSPQGNLIKAYTIDVSKFSVFTEVSNAKKSGKEFWIQHLEGDRLKETYKQLSDFGNEKQYEKMLEDGFQFPPHQYNYFVFGSKISLMFITYESVSEEGQNIFKRFGKVFEQTYTRFLDLQKAEAQAEIARLNLIQIQEEKQKAETALAVLQTTQKQLIQAEKMASLGELTAGIAHEIQNPLNFVNNFSEVSKELVTEMKDELATGNTQIAIEIADDLVQNLEKINHHGQRAAAIVKGMLQHSRSSSGTKEPTDINALCDEYLRLAYHGLRAKDKSFNAKFETQFDENIGKINVMPQELGRVILNLINNAFYAASEKCKVNNEKYEPTVTVTTKKENKKVLITVADNGTGIPQKVLDKIFQPFFTTKPTGQGTGLGLSLSYDIVKAHSGELKVTTKEGEGTEFIIELF